MKNILAKVHLQKPIIYCITNVVTANDCANAIIAMGGSPIMSSEKREAKELVRIANALYINIGTANKFQFSCIFKAIKDAAKKGIPIIIDPVGCGATRFRSNLTKKIIKKAFNANGVIKGNVSELKSILNLSTPRGVDAVDGDQISNSEIMQLQLLTNKTICSTGKTDYICDNQKIISVHNGAPELKTFSGSGCILGAIIATICAVEKNTFIATKIATTIVDISGEIAAKKDQNFYFKNNFLFELSHINCDEFEKLVNIHEN